MYNLYDDNRQGANGIIGGTVLTTLALLAILARVWSKKSKHQRFRFNDYSIFIAWILQVAKVAIYGASVKYGLGWHLGTQVPLTDLPIFMKLQFADSFIWITASSLIKLSILDCYLQIFRGKWFTRAVKATMVFVVVLCVTVWLEALLICKPVSKYWDPTTPGSCGNWDQAFIAAHSMLFLSELTTGILPSFVLWKLQMPVSKKISIALIFGVGILTCAISLLRIIEAFKVSSNDVTYDWVLLEGLGQYEISLGIIVACLPFIQPVVHKALESKIVRSSRRLLLRSRPSSNAGTDNSSPNRDNDFRLRKAGHKRSEDSMFTDTDNTGLTTQNFDVKVYADGKDQHSEYTGKNINVSTEMDTHSEPMMK